MKIISVSACRDAFSYEPVSNEYLHTYPSTEESAVRCQKAISDYENWFKREKGVSLVKMVVIDIDDKSNQITIDVNKELRKELKTRTVVNPEALLAREARLYEKQKPSKIERLLVQAAPVGVQADYDWTEPNA